MRNIITTVFALFLLVISAYSLSSIEDGADWLSDKQTVEGGIYSDQDQALAEQSTVEAIKLSYELDQYVIDPDQSNQFLKSKISEQVQPQTEFIAKALELGISQDANGRELFPLLITYQNIDGGFGDRAGFDSTHYDTAHALAALIQVAKDSYEASMAVMYLLNTQNPDGSWNLAGVSDVTTTALLTQVLWNYRHQFPDVPGTLETSIQFLLSSQFNEVWENDAQTAQALLAILPTVTDSSFTERTNLALEAEQKTNGSWSDDVYSTALALRALVLASKPRTNPDLIHISGTVIDGDTGLPLANIPIHLDGASSLIGVTDSQGIFNFEGLGAGEYSLNIQPDDYSGVNWQGKILPGEMREFGQIKLLRIGTGSGATLAQIQGQVMDSATDLPLAGASVSVSGTNQWSVTDDDGRYLIANIVPGSIMVSAYKQGYSTAGGSSNIQAGQILLFSPTLGPVEVVGSQVFGVVTDSNTGEVLSGIAVSLEGSNTQQGNTDASGYFVFSELNSGPTTLKITSNLYHDLVANLEVALGTQYDASVSLIPVNEPEVEAAASLSGTIIDSTGRDAIEGVVVTITTASGTFIQQTDNQGLFYFENLSAGNAELLFVKEGFFDRQESLLLENSISTDIGLIELEASQNVFGLGGVVLDSTTNLPLANTVVKVSQASGVITLLTDNYGQFYLDNMSDPEVTITFEKNDYQSLELIPVLNAGSVTNLGQVRLRYEGYTTLLPDLTGKKIDYSGVFNDPATLNVTGNLQIDISNQGLTDVDSGFEVTAFYDANTNQRFDDDDTELGHLIYQAGIENEINIPLPVLGTLPYRDAPISVLIDGADAVIESDETNNLTQYSCELEALPIGQIDPVIKWHWSGASYRSDYSQVMSAPVVAQLNDDNADGVINEQDVPDVIFSAFRQWRYNYPGILRALSGADGSEIWTTKDRWVSSTHAPAVADIDGDGLVEIVISGGYRYGSRSLMAFEHNGDLKWQVPVNNFSAPAIADLDNDGQVEIVAAGKVFDSMGNVKWSMNVAEGWPIVVDLDLDGDQEIFSGGYAYNHLGEILWSISGGRKAAVGNFDDDDYPEIAVYVSNSIRLINHDGTLKWGDITVPGGGGGPLTVADVDGDGEPEIGIAGGNYYVVFETDGSLKWKSRTRDYSSKSTGSSVFDFEGDGKAEILYSDELRFRIYDGATGAVLVDMQNPSGTLFEYPLVVDVDNDDHAEIILVSNNYAFSGTRGIRVLENRNDDWMPTRKIWNQHTYHINNINDDGTVPQYEQPGWLSHNSYRLNTFSDRDAKSTYDLTLSKLSIMDNGVGQPLSIRARIGNAGGINSNTTTVDFYRGEISHGQLLGRVSLDAIEANFYRDIALNGVTGLSKGDTITAVVNGNGLSSECGGDNNSQQILADAILGQVTISSDKSTYLFNSNVFITASIANTGVFTSDYQLSWVIEDSTGNQVAELLGTAVAGLSSGDNKTYSLTWNTGQTIAGSYRINAKLTTTESIELDLVTSDFIISATDIDGNIATAQSNIATDKPAYNGWDFVQLSGQVSNNALNVNLPDAEAILTVIGPDGVELLNQPYRVGSLSAQSLFDIDNSLNLSDALAGLYQVHLRVLSTIDGSLLTTSSNMFEVERITEQSLLGSTVVSKPIVDRGEPVSCKDTITNRSENDTITVSVGHLLVSADDEQLINSSSETVTLAPGQQHIYVGGVETSALAIGGYSCVQQITLNENSRTLSFAGLSVTIPPIVITSDIGTKGRILILLDDPAVISSNDLSGLQTQYEYLQSLLDSEGYSYTIVFRADDFANEMASGEYHSYALMSENVTLHPTTEQILGEQVNSGAGLLISGAFNRRNNHIERALGIYVTGREAQADGVHLPAGALGGDWQATTIYPGVKLDFERCGADMLATYVNPVKGKISEVTCYDLSGVVPAAANYQYGKGRGAYIGFDTLDEATNLGGDNTYASILKYTLSYIQPEEFPVESGRVVPLQFNVSSDATDADVRVLLDLPENLSLIDSSPNHSLKDEELKLWEWQGQLEQGIPLAINYYIKLLDSNYSEVKFLLDASSGGSVLSEFQLFHEFEPEFTNDSLVEAITSLEALVQQYHKNNNLSQALSNTISAQNYMSEGNVDAAIANILQAVGKLADESSEPAQQVRLLLDQKLFELLVDQQFE